MVGDAEESIDDMVEEGWVASELSLSSVDGLGSAHATSESVKPISPTRTRRGADRTRPDTRPPSIKDPHRLNKRIGSTVQTPDSYTYFNIGRRQADLNSVPAWVR